MSDTLRERCYRAALDAHPWRVAGETKAVVDTVLSVLHEAEEQGDAALSAEASPPARSLDGGENE